MEFCHSSLCVDNSILLLFNSRRIPLHSVVPLDERRLNSVPQHSLDPAHAEQKEQQALHLQRLRAGVRVHLRAHPHHRAQLARLLLPHPHARIPLDRLQIQVRLRLLVRTSRCAQHLLVQQDDKDGPEVVRHAERGTRGGSDDG